MLASIMSMIPVVLTSRRNRHYFLVLLLTSLGMLLILSQPKSYEEAPFGFDHASRPITTENNHWRGNTKAREIEIPAATWTCTDDHLSEEEKELPKNRRTRQCVVENLCVDREGIESPHYDLQDWPVDIHKLTKVIYLGGFIRASGVLPKNLPNVNIMSSDLESDNYWRPRVERIWRKKMKAHYVDETTMKRFGGTKDSWTFRAGHFRFDPEDRMGEWEMDHFFRSGKELVLRQVELSTPFQSLPPPDAPICFKRAVIGLGSQCALHYCEKNIPAEVYQMFRDEIAQYYWETPQVWEKHLASMQEHIDQERKAKDVKDNGASPLKCLELIRYYNFEGINSDHSQDKGELPSRFGQRFPDIANPESDYSKGDKRKLVVGIIQREESRRLINDQELLTELVKAGFRVKWISFDHGCGLAETAYLLRDVNVVISPHGNAIGTSIFMPTHDPVPTVISVDTSRYSEDWFVYTSTAIGQRFTTTACGPSGYKDEDTEKRCPFYRDATGAKKMMDHYKLILGLPPSMIKTDEKKRSMTWEELDLMRKQQQEYVKEHPVAQTLAAEEFEILIGANQPDALVQKYGDDVWSVLGNFWKAIPRYVDVPRMVKAVETLQDDLDREKETGKSSTNSSSKKYAQFMEYIRNGQACHSAYCIPIINRNVVGETSAFGQYSVDNISKWGQQRPESQALRQGLENPKMWELDV
ncbi:hypothetical protein BGZ79_005453 [Entomortierella chlamydospora]|nr:hypothetical protein BGZ79_005453 [Entomortierella chlamydospora]